MSALTKGAVFSGAAAIAALILHRLAGWYVRAPLPGWEIVAGVAAGIGVFVAYRQRDFQGGIVALIVTTLLVIYLTRPSLKHLQMFEKRTSSG